MRTVLLLLSNIVLASCFYRRLSHFPSKAAFAVPVPKSVDNAPGYAAHPWGFLDDVYIITTTGATDRLATTKTQLEKVGLWKDVKVRTFPVDKVDKVRGCYSSHIEVLREIQNKNKWRFKANYNVLIIEDNLETALGMQDPEVLQAVEKFVSTAVFDVCYLAYMMYVPGMNLKQLNTNTATGVNSNVMMSLADTGVRKHIVQMESQSSSAVVGTTAYIISAQGVDKLLRYDSTRGYVFGQAIPNVMAELFAGTRFAAYPMLFHRSGKIGSLVNPQLDAFRKIMFSPALYTLWERLMVNTGLQNNQLLPAVLCVLLSSLLVPTVAVLSIGRDIGWELQSVGAVFALLPVAVALWGAYLFNPQSSGKGFADATRDKE